MAEILWVVAVADHLGDGLHFIVVGTLKQLHGALDAQPFTTGGQGAIINPTDRSVGKEREHFHAEIQR